MEKTIILNGKELRLVELKFEVSLGEKMDFILGDGIPKGTIIKGEDVLFPKGKKCYYGENPYNDGEILVDMDGSEYDVIMGQLYELDQLIKYL